jgi:ribonuclease E/ribonuclease G
MAELITETRDGFFFAALVDGKTMIDLAIDRVGEPRLYHSIWRATIDRIVPTLGAFAKIGDRSGLFRDGTRKSGDSVIAQIKSLRSEGKADILTDEISIGGKFFVYLSRGEKIRVSRKIDPAAAASIITALTQAGITSGIVRAAAIKTPVETVLAEAIQLRDRYLEIEKSSEKTLLRDGPSAAERLIQDYPHYDLTPIAGSFEQRGIAEQLDALQQKQVKLPGGGGIVIERTAALTAIDVNAGTQNNANVDYEALPIIVRQIRLRNLSGLIVIDFSDDAIKRKPDRILESVYQAFADDPAGARVAGASPSGLIEIIRPLRDLPLAEKLSKIAP